MDKSNQPLSIIYCKDMDEAVIVMGADTARFYGMLIMAQRDDPDQMFYDIDLREASNASGRSLDDMWEFITKLQRLYVAEDAQAEEYLSLLSLVRFRVTRTGEVTNMRYGTPEFLDMTEGQDAV